MCIWQSRRCPGAGGAFCVEKRRLRGLREGRQWTCCVCGGAPKWGDGGSGDYGPLELSRGCWRSVALPMSGRRFCVDKTGFVRSAEWMTLIESIAAKPDVALDAGYLPDFRDAPGARRKPVLRRASATPVPPSGAALILTGTRSAGHGSRPGNGRGSRVSGSRKHCRRCGP